MAVTQTLALAMLVGAVGGCGGSSITLTDAFIIDGTISADDGVSGTHDTVVAPDALEAALQDLAAEVQVPPSCPTFTSPVTAAQINLPQIDEASGLAFSRSNTDIVWVHNDSGDKPRFFALRTDGTLAVTYTLSGINAKDWEDMAAGPGPVAGKNYLYLGDIGDNAESRATIAVHRVEEPAVAPDATDATEALATFDTFQFKYPSGSHNAETLIVDPVTTDLYIVTKKSDGKSKVFRAPAPLVAGKPITLEDVADLDFTSGPLSSATVKLTTGGDVTPDGSVVAVRTYTEAFFWPRPLGMPLHAAFAQPPCFKTLALEPQGETLAFSPAGTGFYTLSEKTNQPLYYYGQ